MKPKLSPKKKDIRGMGMEKKTLLYPLLILVHHPAPPRRLAYLGSAFTCHTDKRKIRRERREVANSVVVADGGG
jgi:hypothetical protein